MIGPASTRMSPAAATPTMTPSPTKASASSFAFSGPLLPSVCPITTLLDWATPWVRTLLICWVTVVIE